MCTVINTGKGRERMGFWELIDDAEAMTMPGDKALLIDSDGGYGWITCGPMEKVGARTVKRFRVVPESPGPGEVVNSVNELPRFLGGEALLHFAFCAGIRPIYEKLKKLYPEQHPDSDKINPDAMFICSRSVADSVISGVIPL